MRTTDHKAALRALAAQDGCEASRRAADHIEYLERRLVSARDYEENLRRALAKVRHQRNELRRILEGKVNDGTVDLWSDHSGGLDGGTSVGCVVSGDDMGADQ